MEMEAKEKNQQLYKPYSSGNHHQRLSSTIDEAVLFLPFTEALVVFPLCGRNHSQGAAVVCAAGDPGAPRFCQLPALRARVRDGRHILLLPERHGEHRGRRGDQAVLCPGAGKLEPSDSQQLSIPPHKPESDRPVGPGGPHPLRRPAAPQVRAAHTRRLKMGEQPPRCSTNSVFSVPQSFSGRHWNLSASGPVPFGEPSTKQRVSVPPLMTVETGSHNREIPSCDHNPVYDELASHYRPGT